MRKTFTIACREYRAMVGTKAFLISLLVMPLLMFGGILAMSVMDRLTNAETLKIAIWDPDNRFYDTLKTAADARNQVLEKMVKSASVDNPLDGDLDKVADKGKSPIPDIDRFALERIDSTSLTDQKRLELSQLVRTKQLHAFVEIPSGVAVLDRSAPGNGDTVEAGQGKTGQEETGTSESADSQIDDLALDAGADSGPLDEVDAEATELSIRFFSESTGLDPARRWLGDVLNESVKQQRFKDLGIDAAQVAVASTPLSIKTMGLVTRKNDGTVNSEEAADTMTALLLPMGIMMMMFMVIMLAAQPMLESVLEEKSQRIAEVLLGSCNPMQLMTGKLLGTVAGSLTIFLFYVIGGYVFALKQNYLDAIPFGVLPWFFLFQMLGVLFYSSIFMAIGASVSQLKEAQSMMMPVWIMLMIPLLTWFVLVQKPDGALAFWLSMFPPTAPTVMVLRISTGITVPIWQILLSLVVLLSATSFCVFLAGRIFRVGILWQGKTPKFMDLLKWAFAK